MIVVVVIRGSDLEGPPVMPRGGGGGGGWVGSGLCGLVFGEIGFRRYGFQGLRELIMV